MLVHTVIFITHPNTWLITCTQPPPPPPFHPIKNSEKGRLYTRYWLKVIRYCVIPLQVPLLFVFTQHFHFENTLRLQTALPRTVVHEHCSSTFTQTLHWRMTWRFFWSFNDSRSQRCCDTGCRDTPTVRIHWHGATRVVFVHYCNRKFIRKVNKQII